MLGAPKHRLEGGRGLIAPLTCVVDHLPGGAGGEIGLEIQRRLRLRDTERVDDVAAIDPTFPEEKSVEKPLPDFIRVSRRGGTTCRRV